jgi:hypothetical protein
MSVSPTESDVNSVASNPTNEGSTTTESPTVTENGAKAESPPAESGQKETLVDRIKRATDSVSEGQSPSPTGKEGEGAKTAAGTENALTEEEAKAFTKDDLPNLHSKTRKRVEKLLDDVATKTKEVETISQERDSYKDAAGQYAKVLGFLKENDLSMDDADTALFLAKDFKHNPAQALKVLRGYVSQLEQITGEVLPEDLAKEVTQGYITEERAKELSRIRADKIRAENESVQAKERDKERQVMESKQLVKTIETSISDWESKWEASDPDYQKKRVEVQEQIKLALGDASREGKMPKTAAEAIKLVEACRKKVEDRISRYQPQRQPIRHVNGTSATTSVRPEAKSLAEAIEQRVNG